MDTRSDDEIVRAVVAAMLDAPALARRTAIVRVAGRPSLGRIERRMAAEEAKGGGSLDHVAREVVAQRHVAGFPARMESLPWGPRFSATVPDGESTRILELTLDRHGPRGAVREVRADPADFGPVHTLSGGESALLEVLQAFGLAPSFRGGVLYRMDPPPAVAALGAALLQAWESAGVTARGDAEALRREAVDREEMRLDEAGMSILAAQLPRGFGEILASAAAFGDRHAPALLGIAGRAQDRARIEALERLGPLASLAGYGPDAQLPAPDEDTTSYVARRIKDFSVVADAEEDAVCRAGPDDAAWLVRRFGSGGIGWIPTHAIRELVAWRTQMRPSSFATDADRAALVRLLVALDAVDHRARLGDVLTILERVEDGARPFGEVANSLCAGGASLQDAASACFGEIGLLRHSVLFGIVLPLAEAEVASRFWWMPSASRRAAAGRAMTDARLRAAMADLLDDLTLRGRTLADLADATLAWVAAGRPGQIPAAFGFGVGPSRRDGVAAQALRAMEPAHVAVDEIQAALAPYLVPAVADTVRDRVRRDVRRTVPPPSALGAGGVGRAAALIALGVLAGAAGASLLGG